MNIGLLFNQIFLMFCLMLLGLLANKIKFIHEQTANDLTNILLYLVSPCLIIKSFEIHYSAQRLDQLLLIASSMLIIYSLQILCSKLIFHAVTDPRLQRITKFGSIYSNAGFIGIPLVSSLFGDRGVFYAVVPIVFFNLFNWTHGVALFNKEESKIGIKQEFFRVIFNPNIIAILLGGLIFASSLQLPGILKQLINDISAINTPLSMLVIGNSFANITLKDCRLSWELVAAVFLRNLIYPLLTVVVISFLGITGMAQAAVVLMMACPVAGIVVLFTLQQHEDPSPAITLMSLSTLLSVITIPLVFIISRKFFLKKELEYLQAAIQKDLTHALNQSARRINNLLNEELKNYHIYASQYQLLVNIKRYHGESSQKLAQILNIKPAAVSRTLKVLVDKELITRQTATDHRTYQLEITNKGNSLLQELSKRDTTIFANYFGHLTASEVEQLLSLVKKLNY